MDPRQPGADVKIHVRQKTVLRIMGSHPYSARIALFDLGIYIAYR
jgi:hypothetical protein